MRLLVPAVAVIVVLTGACAPAKSTPTTGRSTTVAPTPAVEHVVVVDPRELPLPDTEMIPGTFKMNEGSIASAQWNRSWDRDPADPGFATHATRVTITARLYLSLKDSQGDFGNTASGTGAMNFIRTTIAGRGFDPSQIQIKQVDIGPLGADLQSAWRAEFTRGSTTDTYVQYFVFIHVKNTRAIISPFAQNRNGAEAPDLLADTQQLVQKQAARLRALPTTPQIVSVAPSADATATATPTPRPN